MSIMGFGPGDHSSSGRGMDGWATAFERHDGDPDGDAQHGQEQPDMPSY
jgi:hypothetical protein